MKLWNVLVTSLRGHEQTVFRELRLSGEFRRSDFKDVYLGWVADPERFLADLRDNPYLLERIGKAVPLDQTFTFHADDFIDRLTQALLSYLPRLANSRFHVRMERRGYKGRLNSLAIEQEMDRLLKERLLAAGEEGEIDFIDPDQILVVETVANWGGVGLITRELKERYPFVKIR